MKRGAAVETLDEHDRRIAQAANKPRLSFTMFADIEASPRKAMLVPGFLGEGEASCWFGAPGSAKSMIAGDIGAHVAEGRDWFGRRVRQGAVLYVAAERAGVVKRRFAAYRQRFGASALPLAIVGGPANLREGRQDVDLILRYADQMAQASGHPVRLIIVDTISRALAGGDENSPKDMGTLIQNLALLQDSGAHVLTIHHIPADGSGRMRGHGVLLGAMDVTVRVEKGSGVRTATVDKANDTDEGEQIAFSLETVELSHDPETGITTTAPVVVPHEGTVPKAAPPQRQLSDRQKLALESLAGLCLEGKAAPGDWGLPPNIRTVAVEDWKAELLATGRLNAEAANPRVDFRRLCEQLQARQKIGIRNGRVWHAGA